MKNEKNVVDILKRAHTEIYFTSLGLFNKNGKPVKRSRNKDDLKVLVASKKHRNQSKISPE